MSDTSKVTYNCSFVFNANKNDIVDKWDGVEYVLPGKTLLPFPTWLCQHFRSHNENAISILTIDEALGQRNVSSTRQPKKTVVNAATAQKIHDEEQAEEKVVGEIVVPSSDEPELPIEEDGSAQ